MDNKPILLFDGVCNLCHGFVQFILQRDSKGVFQFASLQSDIGQQLLAAYELDNNLSTVVLVENNQAYTHSEVALRVAPQLDGFWGWVKIGWLLPKAIRDGIYNWVAANRYRWFGKKESCWLPDPKWKGRFLD